jgi:hypothetical protein
MYHAGKQSEAHEYKDGQCIHCHMFKVNVDAMSHVCTPEREALIDGQYKAKEGVPSQTT